MWSCWSDRDRYHRSGRDLVGNHRCWVRSSDLGNPWYTGTDTNRRDLCTLHHSDMAPSRIHLSLPDSKSRCNHRGNDNDDYCLYFRRCHYCKDFSPARPFVWRHLCMRPFLRRIPCRSIRVSSCNDICSCAARMLPGFHMDCRRTSRRTYRIVYPYSRMGNDMCNIAHDHDK